MKTISDWLPLIAVLLEFVLFWIVWSIKRSSESAVSTFRSEIDPKLSDHNTRLTTLEVQYKAIPTVSEVKTMTAELAELSSDVKALTVEMRSSRENTQRLEMALDRVNEYLLEHK